jgi:hypothetical protein
MKLTEKLMVASQAVMQNMNNIIKSKQLFANGIIKPKSFMKVNGGNKINTVYENIEENSCSSIQHFRNRKIIKLENNTVHFSLATSPEINKYVDYFKVGDIINKYSVVYSNYGEYKEPNEVETLFNVHTRVGSWSAFYDESFEDYIQEEIDNANDIYNKLVDVIGDGDNQYVQYDEANKEINVFMVEYEGYEKQPQGDDISSNIWRKLYYITKDEEYIFRKGKVEYFDKVKEMREISIGHFDIYDNNVIYTFAPKNIDIEVNLFYLNEKLMEKILNKKLNSRKAKSYLNHIQINEKMASHSTNAVFSFLPDSTGIAYKTRYDRNCLGEFTFNFQYFFTNNKVIPYHKNTRENKFYKTNRINGIYYIINSPLLLENIGYLTKLFMTEDIKITDDGVEEKVDSNGFKYLHLDSAEKTSSENRKFTNLFINNVLLRYQPSITKINIKELLKDDERYITPVFWKEESYYGRTTDKYLYFNRFNLGRFRFRNSFSFMINDSIKSFASNNPFTDMPINAFLPNKNLKHGNYSDTVNLNETNISNPLTRSLSLFTNTNPASSMFSPLNARGKEEFLNYNEKINNLYIQLDINSIINIDMYKHNTDIIKTIKRNYYKNKFDLDENTIINALKTKNSSGHYMITNCEIIDLIISSATRHVFNSTLEGDFTSITKNGFDTIIECLEREFLENNEDSIVTIMKSHSLKNDYSINFTMLDYKKKVFINKQNSNGFITINIDDKTLQGNPIKNILEELNTDSNPLNNDNFYSFISKRNLTDEEINSFIESVKDKVNKTDKKLLAKMKLLINKSQELDKIINKLIEINVNEYISSDSINKFVFDAESEIMLGIQIRYDISKIKYFYGKIESNVKLYNEGKYFDMRYKIFGKELILDFCLYSMFKNEICEKISEDTIEKFHPVLIPTYKNDPPTAFKTMHVNGNLCNQNTLYYVNGKEQNIKCYSEVCMGTILYENVDVDNILNIFSTTIINKNSAYSVPSYLV